MVLKRGDLLETKRRGRPCTTEDTRLSERQELFCEYYLGCFNATESYRMISPDATDNTCRVEGSKMLKKPNVAKYLRERMEGMKEDIVSSSQEVLNFYSEVMRGKGSINYGKPIFMKDRVSCADSLAKYYGMFIERKEITANVTNITVDIEDDLFDIEEE